MLMNNNDVCLCGVRFDNLSTSEAADRIEEFIRDRSPRKILARNASIRVMEDRDPFLRQFYNTCDLVTVDGMAFVYLARLLGCPFREMTGGPSLWYEVLRRAADKGYRVFLLGARQDTLEKAVARLHLQYPRLNIVAYQNGYFSAEEESRIVESVRQARADILMVGMSSPLKEAFIQRNLARLDVPACIGVGGAIDVFAGTHRLAPLWMRKACLEWLYRLWQEPRRLARRYLISNAIFVFLVARELVSMGARRFLKVSNSG